MVRESTDKEGGREVVGRSGGDEDGMRRPMAKTSGRGGDSAMTGLRVPERAHHDLKMDHAERKHGPFHNVGEKPSTRRAVGSDGHRKY